MKVNFLLIFQGCSCCYVIYECVQYILVLKVEKGAHDIHKLCYRDSFLGLLYMEKVVHTNHVVKHKYIHIP